MDQIQSLQYQAKTEAPPAFITAVPRFESAWHQPWSEPARFKILPAVAVVLAATSGYFGPTDFSGLNPGPKIASTWFAPLSEPVRLKQGLGSRYQQLDSLVPVQPVVSRLIQWFEPFSEPVRIKPHLRTGDQPFFFFEPEPPVFMDMPWYNWLSEPVRLPIGLKAWLQQSTAYHPRILPNPSITATMAAIETNADVALFGVSVYNTVTPTTAGTSANVSIHEVKVEDDANAGLSET